MRYVSAIILTVLTIVWSYGVGVGSSPAKPMPVFEDMTLKSRFVEPCAAADPFIVQVLAYEKVAEHELYDGFRMFFRRVGQDIETKPFLALTTDGESLVNYEWIDLNRDGMVDVEGSLSLVMGEQDSDGNLAIANHICSVARRLR